MLVVCESSEHCHKERGDTEMLTQSTKGMVEQGWSPGPLPARRSPAYRYG